MNNPQKRMYIDGEFTVARNDRWIEVINPATEQTILHIPQGDAADVERAIDAAARAQPDWEALPAVRRGQWLRDIAAGIRQREAALSAMMGFYAGTPDFSVTPVSARKPTHPGQ
ncbi:aldehyde dehydrogenase family protein [Serratia bockelmannii]|uniref:aldehyde dehydrogenase family protein n=1 Tax=Serratia bockelmannii TaxID=2703793 RepID=UPI00313DF7FF